MTRLPLKPIDSQVIVITCATSGIGLSIAHMAAARGARVVLTASSEDGLDDIVARIRYEGGRAAAVPADVADLAALERVAARAVSEFGRIDTWINYAGAGMYGRVVDANADDVRRLFETSVLGIVNGVKAAVPHMREGGAGVIINIGSLTSDLTVPLPGLYSVCRDAVKAVTDAIRTELDATGEPIAVSLVKSMPADAPSPQHSHKDMERDSPVLSPDVVARAVLQCAERPVRDCAIGGQRRIMATLASLIPRTADRYLSRTTMEGQKRPEGPPGAEGLRQPARGEQQRGEHPGNVSERSIYSEAMMSPGTRYVAGVAAGVATAAAVRLLAQRRERQSNGGTSSAPSNSER